MTIASIGYAGSISAAEWPEFSWNLVGGYSIGGPGDMLVTPAVGDRTIAIADGLAVGCGVEDVCTSLSNIALPAGTRWDLIALRRNWGTGETTIVRVEGTATKALPGGRESTPGTLDDQPIALVRVAAGSTAIQEVVDLRVWAGDGGVFARDELVLSFLTRLGTRVRIGDYTWTRVLDAMGAAKWIKDATADSGWVGVPIVTASDFVSVANYPAQVRAQGDRVTLRGAIRVQAGGDPQDIMAVVPTGFRPTGPTFLGGYRASNTTWQGNLHIDAAGNIRTVYATGVIGVDAVVPLFGQWFRS